MSSKLGLHPICLLMALWATMIQLSWEIVVYDCHSSNVSIGSLSIRHVPECPSFPGGYKETRMSVHVIEREDVRKVHVRSCLIEMEKTIQYCPASPVKVPVVMAWSKDVYKLGYEECRDVHRFQTFKLLDKTIDGVKMNGTTAKSELLYQELDRMGNCKGVTYIENDKIYENVVVYLTIAIEAYDYWADVDLEANTLTLIDGQMCTYLDGYCIDLKYRENFWEINPNENCNDSFSSLYSGVASMIEANGNQTYVVVEKDSRIFAFKLLYDLEMCPNFTYQTEHPKILIVMPSLPKSATEFWAKSNGLVGYSNSKLLYAVENYEKSLNSSFIDIIYQRCMTQREKIKHTFLSTLLSPKVLNSSLVTQPGTLARLIGEVLHITQCVPKLAELKKPKQCLTDLYIAINGDDMYANSTTRIIKNQSKEVDCDGKAEIDSTSSYWPVQLGFDRPSLFRENGNKTTNLLEYVEGMSLDERSGTKINMLSAFEYNLTLDLMYEGLVYIGTTMTSGLLMFLYCKIGKRVLIILMLVCKKRFLRLMRINRELVLYEME